MGEEEISSLKDIAIEDFNGDLIPDIYVTTAAEATEARIINDTLLVFMNKTKEGDNSYAEVKFETQGILELLVEWSPEVTGGTQNKIYIGGNKHNPTSAFFDLDPSDTHNHGIGNINLLDPAGVYIGYLPGSGKWNIKVVNFQFSNIPL